MKVSNKSKKHYYYFLGDAAAVAVCLIEFFAWGCNLLSTLRQLRNGFYCDKTRCCTSVSVHHWKTSSQKAHLFVLSSLRKKKEGRLQRVRKKEREKDNEHLLPWQYSQADRRVRISYLGNRNFHLVNLILDFESGETNSSAHYPIEVLVCKQYSWLSQPKDFIDSAFRSKN